MIAYYSLRAFVSFILSIFYGEIHVYGFENVPEEGPVIFCGNHPNGLIDPALVMCMVDRKISPIAKSTLFSMPLLGQLLKVVGAVPVRRNQDFSGKAQDNSPAIEAMAQILMRKGCMVIFPEGISHDFTEVQALKTGFARAAVQAVYESKHTDKVTIIPIGLNYQEKYKFRSSVVLELGKPVFVERSMIPEDAALDSAETRQFVHNLTTQMKAHMETVMLTAPTEEILHALILARDLYISDHGEVDAEKQLELMHRFIKAYRKGSNEPDIKKLLDDIAEYQYQLQLLRIPDRTVSTLGLSKIRIIGHTIGSILLRLVTLPLVLPGSLVHAPMGLVIRYASRWFARGKDGKIENDQLALYKIMGALALLPVVYGGIGVAVWRSFGGSFVFPTLCLIFCSGYIAISVRPLQFTLSAIAFVGKYMLFDFNYLKKRRNALRTRVADIVDKYVEVLK